MEDYIRLLINACIHCLCTLGGGSTSHLFGPYLHGTKPNDLLQIDYIELRPNMDGARYVLVLKDDQSGYCWLFSFLDTAADDAAMAITEWSAAFRFPNALMSSGLTNFRNEALRLDS